tara:strand:+ start:79 stop:453 length:375 start_codon:yes stop_codon:yes gene_type:complete
MLITKEILKEADILIAGERHKDYGDKVKNHNNIAKLWSAYLDIKVEAHDVAILMVLLKTARTKLGAVSKDTYVDMSAYGAIAGEIKFKEPKEEESEGERRGRMTLEYVKKFNKKLKKNDGKTNS